MLATHVLQFMFLGYTGFKWPVAYFATTEAHASELMLLVWEVINQIHSYGFKVSDLTLYELKELQKNYFTVGDDAFILMAGYKLIYNVHVLSKDIKQ